MGSQRARLTPQMLRYEEKFDDRGDIRWMPYLMYFHPAGHRSDVVNTDALGFRLSHGPTGTASVGGTVPDGPVRLLAGSSTAFGIGATSDAATLPSRLWSAHAPALPWLNLAGRSHNATQELLLFVLYRHLLPPVSDVVLFSGFNALGLSRLPTALQGDSGAFFNSNDFYRRMGMLTPPQREGLLRRRPEPAAPAEPPPTLDEQIERAVELTMRSLTLWRDLLQPSGARLTYVLQPLATWIRDRPAPQEQALFAELDAMADFGRVYGDIAAAESGRTYAAALRTAVEAAGVAFIDMNPLLADAVDPQDWVFVDRIHFTDPGHDTVARLLAEALGVD